MIDRRTPTSSGQPHASTAARSVGEAVPTAWLLLAFGEQRSYAGNIGYADDLKTVYRYDSFVQNHKRLSEGDLAVVRDKKGLVGLARITRITETEGTKVRQRCPGCSSSRLTTRKVKRPPLYCTNCKHEFVDPIQDDVRCTAFTAFFGHFISVREAISLEELRRACPNYSGQLAMQPISVDALARALGKTDPAIHRMLGKEVSGSFLGPDEGDEIAFVPGAVDERETMLQAIRRRRGQRAFRDALRVRYGDRCVVTGCTLVDVLEAAHISPYRGDQDNHPSNGLLLRADVHTLFDLDLLAIEPTTYHVHLHPAARSAYPGLHEMPLTLASAAYPSLAALRQRWARFLAVQKHIK